MIVCANINISSDAYTIDLFLVISHSRIMCRQIIYYKQHSTPSIIDARARDQCIRIRQRSIVGEINRVVGIALLGVYLIDQSIYIRRDHTPRAAQIAL